MTGLESDAEIRKEMNPPSPTEPIGLEDAVRDEAHFPAHKHSTQHTAQQCDRAVQAIELDIDIESPSPQAKRTEADQQAENLSAGV